MSAEALDGTHDVPFTELFPDDFVTRYTNYPTLQAMIDASELEDTTDLDSDEWNTFVVAHSRFSSWEEMQSEAVNEWAAQKLGF